MRASENFLVIDFLPFNKDTILMKVSNKFTLARIVFAPLFFIFYFLPIWTNSASLAFASACIMIPSLIIIQITDYWDGHYARKYNEVSDFGKLFDPFADVMLNLTVFLCATKSFQPDTAYMPVVIFVLLLYREFSMNFIRMVAVSHGTAIAARKGGKLKTVFYIISSFFFLAIESFRRLGLAEAVSAYFKIDVAAVLSVCEIIAVVFFCGCLLLSYGSFLDYLVHFASVLKNKKD